VSLPKSECETMVGRGFQGHSDVIPGNVQRAIVACGNLAPMKTETIVVLLSLSAALSAQAPRKVFLVDKTYTTGSATRVGSSASGSATELSFSPKIMLAFQKSCPVVGFTQDKASAEFVLDPQVGGSILRNAKGDVLYISPARTLGNMVKDVCRFVAIHPQQPSLAPEHVRSSAPRD
jgi:hypothetical protein